MKAIAPQTRKSNRRAAPRQSTGVAPRGRALGRVSKLAYLIRDQPDLYAKMLNYVRAGAYLHVAAAAIGVAPDTISRWLKKGENARNGSDYSRFRRYVLSAVAEASLVAEAQVKQSKPETWLRCGPRRLLGDEWREADGSANAAVNIESATIVTSPSRADLAAALLELHKAGICLPAADAAFVQSDRRYLPEPSPPQLPVAYAMQRDEPKAGVGPSVDAN